MNATSLHHISRAVFLLACLGTTIAIGGEPDWVRKRPISQEYYVGIGTARKDRPTADYVGDARSVALNDIASQITVSISSDVLRTVFENNERLEQEFESRIHASATADLEGVQLVDTYESDDEYWVYLRLSKEEYRARRAEKLALATSRSLDLYSRGRTSEREGEVGGALGLYAQAFEPIENILAEPLVVQYEGRSVYLVNDIYNALRSLLGRIELSASPAERDEKFGRPLATPLEVRAMVKNFRVNAAANLPFRFRFTRGSGDCDTLVTTDTTGVARCRVQKITGADRLQKVEAVLDLRRLAGGERVPPVVQTVLAGIPVPATNFVLNVSSVDLFVDAHESMFGETLTQKRIEPVVKSELGARNFSFVDNRSGASLAIEITAETRRGGETFGLAFAFASATVSLRDLVTGGEIFKSSISDVKQGSDSFEKAGYKSLETLARRVAAEIIPRMMEELEK
jgi:hypothetical protein